MYHHAGSDLSQHLLLRKLFLFNTGSANTIGTLTLLKVAHLSFVIDFGLGAMKLFLKDRIGFDGLKLGFEVGDMVAMRARIGAATSVGEVISVIL